MIVDVVTGVSPKGDKLSPIDPPASTAPNVSGILAPVEAINVKVIGIMRAQVPQDEPIKYETNPPTRKTINGTN